MMLKLILLSYLFFILIQKQYKALNNKYPSTMGCKLESWERADHTAFSDVTDGIPGALH